MKFLYPFLGLFLAQTLCLAQLIPYNKAGKWGVVNEKRKTIIPMQYQSIEFRNVIILARRSTGTDVFNQQGQIISSVPGLHAYVITLKGRPAAIMPLQNGVEMRYLTGEVAVPAGTYDYIRAVAGGFEIMKNGRYGMLDQNLNEVLPPVNKEIQNYEGWIVPFNGNTSRTILSAKTLKKVKCKFTVNRMEFWEGGYFVTDKVGLKGLRDTLCKEIVPNKYKYIYVGEHIIHAQKLNDKHDLYKKNGKKLVKDEVLEYESSPNFYLISTKKKTYFYRKNLKLVRETNFEHVEPTNLPTLFYAKKDGKTAIIDSTAKIIFPFQKDGYWEVYENYAVVGGKRGFYSNRFMRLELGEPEPKDSMRLVFRNGKEVKVKVQGRFLGMPENNRIAVIRGEKIGFVDFKGREVIPFIFDYDKQYELMHYGMVRTYTFDQLNGKALMFQNEQNVYIDSTGTVLKDLKPDLRSYHKPFGNGYKLVHADEPFNQVGIVNAKEEFVVPLSHEPIQFVGDKFLVLSKNKKKALFDLNLQQITDYKYDMIHDPRMPGLLFVSRDGITGYINTKGEEYFE